MIPNKIVISKFASEEGADITVDCVLVREKNKDKLIESLKKMLPDTEFIVMSETEYLKCSK
jgi:hypothetical protein